MTNKTKKLIGIILILLLTSPLFAEEAQFDPFPQNKGTIYEYGDDIPNVCFFPIDKARWDGYKITNKNWSQLTDYQKVMFMNEGIKEIERQENVKIGIEDDPRLLIAINGGVDALGKDIEVPVIRFLRDLTIKDSISNKNK